LATTAGRSPTDRAEFEVTFAGGIKRTFPADTYLFVVILPDLA